MTEDQVQDDLQIDPVADIEDDILDDAASARTISAGGDGKPDPAYEELLAAGLVEGEPEVASEA